MEKDSQVVDKTKQTAVAGIIIDDKDIVIGFNPDRPDVLLSPGKKK